MRPGAPTRVSRPHATDRPAGRPARAASTAKQRRRDARSGVRGWRRLLPETGEGAHLRGRGDNGRRVSARSQLRSRRVSLRADATLTRRGGRCAHGTQSPSTAAAPRGRAALRAPPRAVHCALILSPPLGRAAKRYVRASQKGDLSRWVIPTNRGGFPTIRNQHGTDTRKQRAHSRTLSGATTGGGVRNNRWPTARQPLTTGQGRA